MRYLVAMAGVLLMLIGGVGAFDGFMAGRQADTVWQQISERIKFYGCGGLFAFGLIALALASIDSACRKSGGSTSPRKSAESISAEESPKGEIQPPDEKRGLRITLVVILVALLVLFLASKLSSH